MIPRRHAEYVGAELRHAVRVALVIAVAKRGVRCWPSANAAAIELAPLIAVELGRPRVGVSTVRRALSHRTLSDEAALAVENRSNPVSKSMSKGLGEREQRVSSTQPDEAGHQVKGTPGDGEHQQQTAPALISSTTKTDELSGCSALRSDSTPLPTDLSRRPKKLTPSEYDGTCYLCQGYFDEGEGQMLTPYKGTPRVFCVDHARNGLEWAQFEWDAAYLPHQRTDMNTRSDLR